MDLKALRYDVDRGVGLVTLDRPDRMNAWTARMELEYRWALGAADCDDSVGVIVVTGAGRAFCAGADFRALDRIAAAGAYIGAGDEVPLPVPDDAPADLRHAHTWPLALSKPVLAAINGAAAGVGFVLACFADVRFAAAGAKLTTSFSRVALPAEHGVSWRLPRLIGAGRAADLLLSGRVVLAEEALAMGLVDRVVAPEELLDVTLAYGREMVERCSPSALRVIKRQLWVDQLGGLDAAATQAESEMDRMVGEPEFDEAARALAERRPPRFRA